MDDNIDNERSVEPDNIKPLQILILDDFYKSVNKIRNTPVISTKNYKAALEKYTKGKC